VGGDEFEGEEALEEVRAVWVDERAEEARSLGEGDERDWVDECYDVAEKLGWEVEEGECW
jgi:hypothetical protein